MVMADPSNLGHGKKGSEKRHRHLEEDLRAFEQDSRKEIADQADIDKMVEKMAKIEIKRREVEGDKMGMNNHWLKFKISQFEEDWKADTFNEFHTSYGMCADASKWR